MSRYLSLVGALSRTPGNDLCAYLALATALAALPGAVLFFAVLSALALLRRLLSAIERQLGALLHSGRVLLADRLRRAAVVIDPWHQAEEETAPEPACEPVVPAAPVPVLMPAAAQVTVEAPARTAGERERLAAALAEHGSIRAAARALGVGESTLRGRLKWYGIEAPSGRGRTTRVARAA